MDSLDRDGNEQRHRATLSALASPPALAGNDDGSSTPRRSRRTRPTTTCPAVDPVGNEGAPSNQSAVVFDVHAPAITITGVSNGLYTSANLTPAVTIADFSPSVATVTLNGQPFASGVTLTLPGAYFLSVAASDVFANASSATVSFTIDKATPTFVLLSPSNGLITNQNVFVSYQASDDLTPIAQIVVKDELGVIVPSSYTSDRRRAHRRRPATWPATRLRRAPSSSSTRRLRRQSRTCA